MYRRLEEELITIGNTPLKIELIVNTENSIYIREKESDNFISSTFRMKTSDFIVFSYISETKNYKDNENVYLSYPHIFNMRKTFKKSLDMFKDCFVGDDENGYTVPLEMQNTKLTMKNLSSDKFLAFAPTSIPHSISGLPSKAINIFINSYEKVCTLNKDAFINLAIFLEGFDLYSSSKLLFNTALYYSIYNKNRELAPAPKRKTIVNKSETSNLTKEEDFQ